jgi:hypothetical protein
MSDQRTDPEGRARIDEALELAALEAARAAAKKTAARAAGGYFALLLVLLAGLTAYQRNVNDRLDHANRQVRETNARLDVGEQVQCQRVQKSRERSNVSEARQYLVLINAVSNPRTPARIRERYTDIANTSTYDPPTDCRAAVAHPLTYRRPPSMPFSRLGLKYANSIIVAARADKPQPLP